MTDGSDIAPTQPVRIVQPSLEQQAELRAIIDRQMREETSRWFGAVAERWIEYAIDYYHDERYQQERLAYMLANGIRPGVDRILDVSAGCGQFVFTASRAGFECHGVEPEAWKRQYIRTKSTMCEEGERIAARIIDSVGEHMPYGDATFDCVTTVNTLEHVDDPFLVIREMLRVTRAGGVVLIQCPDYRSTVENHYRLPWLPLFPRFLARFYLRLLGRPTAGLDTLRYVTKPRILRWLSRAERELGLYIQVMDTDRQSYFDNLRRRQLPLLPGGYHAWRILVFLRSLFREKLSVNFAVRILAQKKRPRTGSAP